MGNVTHVFDVDEPGKINEKSHLTDRIRACLGKTGLTVKEIAARVGVSVQMIYKLCSGASILSYWMAILLADLCDVTVDYLLFGGEGGL